MCDTNNEALIAEAREYAEGWERDPEQGRAWRPFDQAERIPFWDDELATLTDADRASYWAAIKAWENVHAHDVRLKCYPEFQCAVIESYAADLVIRLVDALEVRSHQPDESDWEYQCKLGPLSDGQETSWIDVEPGHVCSGRMQRRRKAGPWEPVTPQPENGEK